MRFSSRGFTLMELMISVAILIVVIVGFLASFLHSIMLTRSSREKTIALNDAQFVLESMKAESFADLLAYIPPAFSNLHEESVSVVASIVAARRVAAVATVTWKENDRERSVELYTEITR